MMEQTNRRLEDKEELSLASALTDALEVLPKARSADHALFFQMIGLRDTPESAPTRLKTLLDVTRALPALELFNIADQYAFGQSHRVDSLFLVGWLVSRAQQVGARQAVADLNRYLLFEPFELTETFVVDGISVESPIDIGEYQLVPWEILPMTDTKYRMLMKTFHASAFPSAAILHRHSLCAVHVRPWDPPPKWVSHSLEPTLDLLRCATAVTNAGVRYLYHWFEPPQWVPWAVAPISFATIPRVGADSVIDAKLAEQLSECFGRLCKTEEAQRVRLRIPLDRLNKSHVSAHLPVEASIDLGVAFESLYAPTKLSEGIGFAVRTRAARFLEPSVEKRREVADLVKEIYDLRSRAVHTGRFDADGKKKWQDLGKVHDVLDRGRKALGQALCKVIVEGEPDWDDFDIS